MLSNALLVSHLTSTPIIADSLVAALTLTRLRLFYDGQSSCATTELTPVGSQCSCPTRLLDPKK